MLTFIADNTMLSGSIQDLYVVIGRTMRGLERLAERFLRAAFLAPVVLGGSHSMCVVPAARGCRSFKPMKQWQPGHRGANSGDRYSPLGHGLPVGAGNVMFRNHNAG